MPDQSGQSWNFWRPRLHPDDRRLLATVLYEARDFHRALEEKLDIVVNKENQIMSAVTDALDQAEAAAKANSDADDSAEKLLLTLVQMIKDLQTSATDPATITRIQALASALTARASQLGTAVAAGTPAAV